MAEPLPSRVSVTLRRLHLAERAASEASRSPSPRCVGEGPARSARVGGPAVKPLPARIPGRSGSVEPHVEADSDETLYATDPSANAVFAIAPSGRVEARWDADDAGAKFRSPTGVALDRKDRILYVVNSGDGSISKKRLPERKER